MDAKTYIKAAQKAGIRILVSCMPEDQPIEGNAIASGDEAFDKEVCDGIRERLESGNEWAWCVAKVEARIELADGNQLSEAAYLGACTDGSESEFVNNSGYYEQLAVEAIDAVRQKLRLLYQPGEPLLLPSRGR